MLKFLVIAEFASGSLRKFCISQDLCSHAVSILFFAEKQVHVQAPGKVHHISLLSLSSIYTLFNTLKKKNVKENIVQKR